ncbi:MAG: HAMP domain-containing histidine kinase [Bacteroidia bacterium]|nr:HAMP domain-containing histidine kinase [Bacteroidia bacterium]
MLAVAQEQLVNPPEFLEKVTRCYEQRLANQEKLYFKDGRIFDRYGSAITGEDGTYYGYVWFFMNITEQENLARQKDDFLGIASHELKTPVTSIKAYTQVLKGRFQKAEDHQSAQMLHKMDTQLNKLTGLISDLLDVTKIEQGKLQLRQEFFNLEELVYEIVEEIQRTTEKHHIITQLDELPTAYGDRERIGQVIINFLTNAIKYAPQAYEVIVRTEMDYDTEQIVLCVKDFGLGLLPEDQARVFDRFYRASGHGSETYPGLGLGLYISAEIIARHQGRIWVKSEPGKGSSFFLRFAYPKITKSGRTLFLR